MTYLVTDADIAAAEKAIRHEQNGREPYAGAVLPRAREIAEQRYRHEKPTERGLEPILLASERITGLDLGVIVVEEEEPC